MKKIFMAIVLCLMCAVSFTQDSNNSVYICTGGKSTKYHKTSTCSGLNRCSGEIKQITLKEAASKGRTPCAICYK